MTGVILCIVIMFTALQIMFKRLVTSEGKKNIRSALNKDLNFTGDSSAISHMNQVRLIMIHP